MPRIRPRCIPHLALLLVVVLVLGTAPQAAAQSASPDAPPKNVILFIPDGYGPASATLARDFLRYRDGVTSLATDSLLVGAVRTFAADSRVTDSAAGATAYAASTKTYNGAISVDTDERPVATLLEAAEARGMATGLVATSRITHATPAAFSAHVVARSMENAIAAQQITKDIEVILGGGRRHFLPEAEGGTRQDDRNLIAEAREQGYRYVADRDQLEQVDATPVLGLFGMSHMDYEIDRDPAEQPSLAAMTRKAIDLLQDDEDGFFLMVEASRIDHAGHANDAAAHLHDILAFNEALEVALDAARADGNTLVVSVSDHETGGLTLGRNVDGRGVYAWRPEALARVQGSHGAILSEARDSTANDGDPARTIAQRTGITDLTEAEKTAIRRSADNWPVLSALLTELVARRAVVGWTTNGHTAVDVNLYAYGPGANRFAGNHDNTYVGAALAELLDFDLAALTEQLRAESASTRAGQ